MHVSSCGTERYDSSSLRSKATYTESKKESKSDINNNNLITYYMFQSWMKGRGMERILSLDFYFLNKNNGEKKHMTVG